MVVGHRICSRGKDRIAMPRNGSKYFFTEPELSQQLGELDLTDLDYFEHKSKKFPVSEALQKLTSWRRFAEAEQLHDGAAQYYRNLLPRADDRDQALLRAALYDIACAAATPTAVHTIGGRKANVERPGRFSFKTPMEVHSLRIDGASEEDFLRGEVGHVYTGIVVLDRTTALLADFSRIYLVANNPPDKATQQSSAISEPYLNRPHAPDIQAVVHGQGATSHDQLQALIIRAKKQSGVPTDSLMFFGFTVMKGGMVNRNDRNLGNHFLPNLYGWTSSSQNRTSQEALGAVATPVYVAESEAQRRMIAAATGNTANAAGHARLTSQMFEELADKVAQKLDELLERSKATDVPTVGRHEFHFDLVLLKSGKPLRDSTGQIVTRGRDPDENWDRIQPRFGSPKFVLKRDPAVTTTADPKGNLPWVRMPGGSVRATATPASSSTEVGGHKWKVDR